MNTTPNDSDWWMFSYKVAPCPIQERHDWSTCPNAHRGERAARRCPRTYSYTPEPCPEYNKTGACANGVSCPLAHSVFESWLHPSRFRTQLCCFGSSCKRRICFFAHDPSQLRAATQTAGSAAAAVAAAATGAPVMRRTQAVVPASMMGAAYSSAGAGSSGGSMRSAQGAAAASLLAASAGMLPQQGQQLMAGGMQGVPPWVYTGAGWVQAPGMLVPMPGMQAQQQMAAASMAGMVPMDQAMLGLASGLSGLNLQSDTPELSSAQGLACMPTMLPNSPDGGLLYPAGSAAYSLQAQAAAMSPQVPGAAAMVYAPSPVATSMPGMAMGGAASLAPSDASRQQNWQ